MSAGFKMEDYVDVAQRIHEFYERFPDGRLVTGTEPRVEDIGGKPFIWYHAKAYRTPDDPLPGDGWAAEPVPGPTQFTFNSELMNAETAAWGRAIVALGFSTKKIASAQEVNARRSEPAAAAGGRRASGEGTSTPPPDAPPTQPESYPDEGSFFPPAPAQGFDAPAGDRTEAQAKMLHHLLPKIVKAGALTDDGFIAMARDNGAAGDGVNACIDTLSKVGASALISRLKEIEAQVKTAA